MGLGPPGTGAAKKSYGCRCLWIVCDHSMSSYVCQDTHFPLSCKFVFFLLKEKIFLSIYIAGAAVFFKCSTLDTLSGKTQINHVCFLQHHSLLSPLSPSSSSFLLMFEGVLVAGCRAQGLPHLPCLLHRWAELNDRLSSASCVCPCTLPLPGLLLGNNLKSPHSSSLKALFFLHNQSVQSVIDQFTD